MISSGDIVEPTDNLYKEGNIINKHTYKRKRNRGKGEGFSRGKGEIKDERKSILKDKALDGLDGDDDLVGKIVDVEV